MKLLLDANISWRLANRFKVYFDDCIHVDHCDLNIPASDTEIWNYALVNDCVIVTNDEDFLNFSNVKGYPPKIILLGTGNQSTNFIEELLIKHKNDIEELYKADSYGVLELF